MASRVLYSAAQVYNRVINSKIGGEGTTYLINRGIDPQMVNVFTLGTTPPKNMFIRAMLKESNEYVYSTKDLIDAGLIYNNGDGLKETFQNSIILPVHNSYGQVHTITSRYIDDNPKKYNNIHSIPINKFYGEHQIRNRNMYPTKKGMPQNYVIICEGQFDTIIATQNGYFSLGLLGANSFKEGMLETIAIFDSIILALDNDAPGSSAQEEVGGYIKHAFSWKDLYSLRLPKGIKDLNEFYLKSPDFCLEDRITELKVKPKKMKKSIFIQDPIKLNTFEERINNLDLKKIIERAALTKNKHIKWKPQGEFNLITNCVFRSHKDLVSSFVLYTKTNSFYCFGCGKGGKASQFLHHFYKDEDYDENLRA
jgi:DNA primase